MTTRTVTLVLVSPDGELLGEREPFETVAPWWQGVDEFGPGQQTLRLLHADRPAPPGGHVTYLAQTTEKPRNLKPTQLYGVGERDHPGGAETPDGAGVRTDPAVITKSHPHRAAYAEIGGPAASLAWAADAVPGTTASQRRTWNLSAIWRLDDRDGLPVAWLKQVPRFFAHEPFAIRLVAEIAPDVVPDLIADGDQGRMLLAHAPGQDRYGAGADLCARTAAAFHPIQAGLAGAPALDQIPDARLDRTLDDYRRVAAPHLDAIPGLARLIDDLPARFAAIAACGLPDTLVHGDLHPGNVRTDDHDKITIMDWGDCVLGHPGFDILRLTEGVDGAGELIDQWVDRWRRSVPGSDPRRAIDLLRPVAPLRSAVIYQTFLANIEPTEWPYHAADVPDGLAAAASIVEA